MTTTTIQSDPSLDEWLHLAQQLRMRYPDALLDIEIVVIDLERDLIILKATAISGGELLDGSKGCGLAAGSLTQIAHLALSAKRQALADLGIPIISTMPEPSPMPQQQEAHGDAPTPTPAVSLQPSNTALAESDPQVSALKPMRTAATVKALYAKAYQIPAPQQEVRWRTFAMQVLGRTVTDEQFSEAELERLHSAIQQQLQRRTTSPQLPAKTPSLPKKG